MGNPTDFNDLAQLAGLEAVKALVARGIGSSAV